MTKNTRDKDARALNLIRNKLIHEGVSPTLAEINKLTGGKSPRSASLILDRLEKANLIKRLNGKVISTTFDKPASISTVNIPLVGSIPCGMPMLAEENIETYIPISTTLAQKGSKYFLLRAIGDSMDRAGINNSDLLLIRKQETADNGNKVVALINDEATVKIFEKRGNLIILHPKSNNKNHQPIILTSDCIIQGVVVEILPKDIY